MESSRCCRCPPARDDARLQKLAGASVGTLAKHDSAMHTRLDDACKNEGHVRWLLVAVYVVRGACAS